MKKKIAQVLVDRLDGESLGDAVTIELGLRTINRLDQILRTRVRNSERVEAHQDNRGMRRGE